MKLKRKNQKKKQKKKRNSSDSNGDGGRKKQKQTPTQSNKWNDCDECDGAPLKQVEIKHMGSYNVANVCDNCHNVIRKTSVVHHHQTDIADPILNLP